MRFAIAHMPRLIAERRSSAILGVVLILMLWAGVIVKFIENVHTAQREAERTNQNFAMLFEESVRRSIGEIDKALLYLRRAIESRGGFADYETIVRTTDVLSEIIVQVAIIDAAGILRASSAGTKPGLDLSDREHYRFHLGTPEDRLYISKPMIGRATGRWSVQFTRRIADGFGRFAGVVVASLDPEHFSRFYEKIEFGPSASTSLIGADGVVRSSGGGDKLRLGANLSGSSLFRRIQNGSAVTYADDDLAHGQTLLFTLREVRGYPLWVAVSVHQSEILQSAVSALATHLAVAVALTLMILIAVDRIMQTEAKATQKAEQLQLTLENMSQGIMLVTKDRDVPVINRRCGELLNLPSEFVNSPPRFDRLLEPAIRGGGPETGGDRFAACAPPAAGQVTAFEHAMPNGTVLEVRRRALADGGFVQTFTDITERWRAEALATRLASEDPLTGLLNRRVFGTALDERCRRAIASDSANPHAGGFAVLLLDLDRFKVINDSLGHRIGDLLLQETAKRLQDALRPGDALARLGGDEFAVATAPLTSRAEAADFAASLVRAIADPYTIDGHRVLSTASIGIAIAPQDGPDADELLMAADLALYAVKAEKRGAFKFYASAMNTELNERRQIEIDLREAIERDQLELHYQPIMNLRRNAIIGFEALARWRHPVRGLVPPAAFIPVAEDSGLIAPLGEWSLLEACRQAATWPDGLRVAVNLSPAQFRVASVLQVVERALAETGLPPRRLELEITERIFLEDSQATLQTLRRLKRLGVRIAMDDFGSGYSSLSYLRCFPFDKIKIDRAFIDGLREGSDHAAIVQAVIAMARALGMATTAEGVEKLGQQQLLTALGCDEAQGYLFSPPVPSARTPELLVALRGKKTLAA